MGAWLKEEQRQEKLFEFVPFDTRSALRVVSYWVRELGVLSARARDLIKKILTEAPEQKRITSRVIASDRLLKLVFGDTVERPPATQDVKAEVFDFARASANTLDRKKSKVTPPLFIGAELDSDSVKVVKTIFTQRPPKAKPKKFGAGVLLLLLLLAEEGA